MKTSFIEVLKGWYKDSLGTYRIIREVGDEEVLLLVETKSSKGKIDSYELVRIFKCGLSEQLSIDAHVDDICNIDAVVDLIKKSIRVSI